LLVLLGRPMSQEVQRQRHHFQRRWIVVADEFDLHSRKLLPWWPEEAKDRSLDLIKAPRDTDAIA
jgi:hypothetical protein